MIESDADRLESLQALGEQLKIDDESVWGIFENEYLGELDGPGVASSEPTVTVRTSDIMRMDRGALVVRANGERYSVRQAEPDGTGMTMLRLRANG